MNADAAARHDDLEGTYRTRRVELVRLALLLSGSRELAEDVVQTVFTEVHGRWDRIDDPGAYLRRAVVNRVKDAQRRTFRSHRLPVTRTSTTGIPELDETWGYVRRLPPVQRAVLVLHLYDDLPLTDVAALLGRPPATVRSDLRRALARLRKVMP